MPSWGRLRPVILEVLGIASIVAMFLFSWYVAIRSPARLEALWPIIFTNSSIGTMGAAVAFYAAHGLRVKNRRAVAVQ